MGDGQWATSHPDLLARSTAKAAGQLLSSQGIAQGIRALGTRSSGRKVVPESRFVVDLALGHTAPRMGFVLSRLVPSSMVATGYMWLNLINSNQSNLKMSFLSHICHISSSQGPRVPG